jgi:DNA-binding Lrp family transcriptional regulator
MGFAVFRDEDDLSGFIEKKVVTLPGVLQCETFVFLHVEKGRRVQFAPTNDSPDTKLVELLQEDGRQSATTLGKKLGVSPAIIRRRIRQLIKDGTIRTVAVVNISKIGMRLIAIIGLQVVPSKALQVQKVLAKLPNIKVAAGVTGRFDVIIWARFNSIEELSNFVEHDLGSMDGVKGSETFTCLRVARGGLTQL